jgi:predicted ATPase with chaperone activity
MAVHEGKERVRSATKNSGFKCHFACLTVNPSPTKVRKGDETAAGSG